MDGSPERFELANKSRSNLAGADAGSNRAEGEVAGGSRAAGPIGGAAGNEEAAGCAAGLIHAAYVSWQRGFEAITRRARARFESRDWWGAQADATERLALYRLHLDAAVAAVREALDDSALRRRPVWTAMKAAHAALAAKRPDREVAETFFNSVTRRIFGTVGVDPEIEYTESPVPDEPQDPPIYDTYAAPRVNADLVRRLLLAIPWSVPYAQLDRDAALVAELIDARVRAVARANGRAGVSAAGSAAGAGGMTGARSLADVGSVAGDATGMHSPAAGPALVEIVRSVFFRNKGAYVVGRIRVGDEIIPLVLPLLRAERGIVVDAVLMTENEASIVFGFSWSYFRVEVTRPRELVEFLRSIMPFKRTDELYTSIGYNKHGKTELYRTLMRHLERPDARFAMAEGDEGLVMAVFTLPSLNVVFKVIKDSFAPPKNTTRKAVMDRYAFVFVRDRVGRLADAQEFEHLEFPKRCFPDELLAYLLQVAGGTVRVEGDRVIVGHVYTERRVVPLNLFLRDADPDAAREAVLDYGNAIKDLAAADIFTGDMLLKNFGVTRHGRVICYDYDELCLLSDCRFRRIPPPPTPEDELAAEPWFPVGEHDVFPEEFRAFLVPPGRLRAAFLAAHSDLLDVEFWQSVQRRLAAGEVFDVFPYRRSARLQRGGDVAT